MLKNYLKIAIRNAKRHRLYSIINILGLMAALTGALFLLLYVTDELSYDKHHEHADRVYRIVSDVKLGENDMEMAMSPNALGEYLHQNYPEVESYARLRRYYWEPFKIKKRDNFIEQPNVFIASSGVFDVFSFHFLQGDPSTALTRPNSIVMTQSMAEKYFGGDVGNVIGKTVTAENDSVYQVTGLIEDVTQNSHFTPAAFLSFAKRGNPNWYFSSYAYVRVQPGTIPGQFEEKIQEVVSEKLTFLLEEVGGGTIKLILQPLADIHFYSKRDGEIQANSGNMNYIYTFSVIAFFLILLAAINYINLATARGLQRAKEVGVRKSLGAARGQLMGQFLAESFMFVLLAVLGSILLLFLLSPVFNYFTGKNYDLYAFAEPVHFLWLTVLLLFLTLLSGGYPAFFLSRFRPVRVLKGSMTAYGQENVVYRKMLVVVQFTISLVLITSTLIVFAQLKYWNTQELGFDKEQVVKISVGQAYKFTHTLKDALLQHPNITRICTTENPPGSKPFSTVVDTDEKTRIVVTDVWADFGYISALNIPLLSGRNFRDNIRKEVDLVREHAGVLVNESLVKQMGWDNENAIGKKVTIEGQWKEEIIGVLKDFHITSLHDVIEPMMVRYEPYGDFMLIKISGNHVPETLEFIQNTWNEITGTSEVAYTFLDQHFQQQYEADEKRGRLFAIFSGIIIFIACLGLFGLATFTAGQRTKEIGIRKVMGASMHQILFLLSKDYLQLLIISIVIAIPVANYFITDWLKSFAYKIPLEWWMFAVPGLAVLFVALFSIGGKTMKVARKIPVDSLQYE